MKRLKTFVTKTKEFAIQVFKVFKVFFCDFHLTISRDNYVFVIFF